MIKRPYVSIIVPVYNVEKYLPVCIESILLQTISDFELLLINDGSTDNSGEICNEYARLDNRVSVYHQKNAGASIARNRGIEEAISEYICFMDSDDWVDKEFLDNLCKNSDISDLNILTPISYDYEKYSILKKPQYSKGLYEASGICEFLIENDFFTIGDGGSCSKLYRKSIISQDGQRFLLNNAAYEDTLFTVHYLSKCEKVFLNEGAFYHYMHRGLNSLSTIRHPYSNYLDSGTYGLNIFVSMIDKYHFYQKKIFFIKGVTKFMNILNYSIFSLYRCSDPVDKDKRLNLIKELSLYNNRFKKGYKPSDIRLRTIKLILSIPSKRAIDFLLFLLFSASKKIIK